METTPETIYPSGDEQWAAGLAPAYPADRADIVLRACSQAITTLNTEYGAYLEASEADQEGPVSFGLMLAVTETKLCMAYAARDSVLSIMKGHAQQRRRSRLQVIDGGA